MQHDLRSCHKEIRREESTTSSIKTRFTILIFSEKGNKQAGEVTLDVAEFLNNKQKQIKL